MSSTLFKLYKQGISKRLLSKLIVSFKDDFREFKQVYQTQYRLRQFLIELRQRQI